METVDIAIVGAGPAGLAAAAHAAKLGLRYVAFERSRHLADTIHCYQKNKLVMAEPALVPTRSELPFVAGSREQILEAWALYAAQASLNIEVSTEVLGIQRVGALLHVRTSQKTVQAQRVVLALGTQGNPRKLGVPGEDLPHVVDRLVDPAAYQGEDIVVVGAGDSALEIALALCERNRVHLVVRTAEIVRAKESLERDVLMRQASGQLMVHFSSRIKSVGASWVDIAGKEEDLRVGARLVIVKIGADPPRKLLEGWGIEFAGQGREARPRLGRHYESVSMPGVHLIGAVTGRDLIKLGINQGYEVVEAIAGREVEPADELVLRDRLPFWSGPVAERIATLRDAVPLLQAAEDDQLREIFLAVSPREYQPGQVILRQNDYTDSLLILTDGVVAISRRSDESPKSPEEKVARLSAGNFLGEMGLISGRRRNATATAETKVQLLEIPRKAILKLLHLAPAVRATIDRTFLIRALRNFIFPDLPDAELWKLAKNTSLVSLERQKVIFREGDAADALYLLRSGMVKITRREGEREVVLTYLVAGNYFGEGAFLENKPRRATVTTIFPTELIVLRRADFDAFLAAQPRLRERFQQVLERRELASLSHEVVRVGEVLSQLIETEAVMGTDVLIIDNHKCVRCGNCMDACAAVHEDGAARLSLSGSRIANLLLPNSCMQCENPLCMLDCPPDAIIRRPGGEVFIKDSCIGCGNCSRNCPYDNIFMVQPKRGFFDWVLGLAGRSQPKIKQEVAVKCDLCRDLGGGPACVRSCPTGAAIRLEPKDPEDLRRSIEQLVQPGDLF